MNGIIIFNSDDGSLLLHKQYVERFGFDPDIKEASDVLYLSTLLFSLYCNACFIQNTPNDKESSTDSIHFNDTLLILFRSAEQHPYVVCTIHSTACSLPQPIAYEICNTLSEEFQVCLWKIKGNKADEERKQNILTQFKQDIHKILMHVLKETVEQILLKTVRQVSNAWIVYDSQYFRLVDAQQGDLDESRLQNVKAVSPQKEDQQEDFNDIIKQYEPPNAPRFSPSESSSSTRRKNTNMQALYMCGNYVCCKWRARKLAMNAVLKYEHQLNENFESLSTAIECLEEEMSVDLSSQAETEYKIKCAKWIDMEQQAEYWYVRCNDYCLIVCMAHEEKQYPVDVSEFVDRNLADIVNLFNFIKLQLQ